MVERWRSYDSVAATYDRVAVPAFFRGPARDLVAVLELSPNDVVLDVGTGTGVAARVAVGAVGPGGAVIGVDTSPGMLEVARDHGVCPIVVGAATDLPFGGERFDHVIASFVLSHLRSYEAGLTEMVRVLRRGGRLAVTAWETIDDQYRQFWRSAAAPFAGQVAFEDAVQQVIPWEEWFADAVHLRQAVADAGIRIIEVRTRHYATHISIADFLSLRETSTQARYMQSTMPPEQWRRFTNSVSRDFRSRFSDPLEVGRDVHLAVGMKT